MKNSGFDKTKITHYTSNEKKLTNQNNERYKSVSDGGLKSCVEDLIKFKKFTSLLNNNSLLLIQKLYIFFKNGENDYFIGHNGNMTAIKSNLSIKYDKNWKFKDIQIYFNTIKN